MSSATALAMTMNYRAYYQEPIGVVTSPKRGGSANMQKILRSPASMKKKVTNKTFGVPLRELSQDGSGIKVPYILKKVSDFIQMHGIGHEGIFRVNGSTRVVDNLKTQFDRNGDADLEEAEDVMAVAGLLKLFLRELPDPVMTEHLHQSFISVQEEFKSDRSECSRRIKHLIQQLPEENYIVLQYIISFLVKVSKYEDTNKMSSQALAIVFGPNLFRCGAGLQGLREQGITNCIVRTIIEDYHKLFKDIDTLDEDESRQLPVGSKRIEVQAAKSGRSPPVIKRRLQRMRVEDEFKDYNSNSYSDTDREELRRDQEDKSVSEPSTHSTHSSGLLSPRDVLSGDSERSFSPFNLDSENGTSCAPSPIINDVASELVEQTIKQSVTQHLFGGDGRSESPLDDAPVPSPRRRRHEKKKLKALKEASQAMGNSTEESEATATEAFQSVQSRIRHFADSGQPPGGGNTGSPEYSPRTKRKQLPSSSKAFELFESQGIVIGPKTSSSSLEGSDGSDNSQVLKPRRKAPEAPIRPSKGSPRGSPQGSPGATPSGGSPRSKSPKLKSPKPNMRLLEERRGYSGEERRGSVEEERRDSLGSEGADQMPEDEVAAARLIEDFESVQRNSPALKSLTCGRAPPPKNRRSPSRKTRLKRGGSESPDLPVDDIIQIPQEYPMEQSSPPPPPPHVLPSDSYTSTKENTPHQVPQPKPRKKKSKPRTNGHMGGKEGEDTVDSVVVDDGFSSPPRSPRTTAKTSNGNGHTQHHKNGETNHRRHVPPLNLSSLHEHGDGNEPIPAWQAQSHLDPEPNEAVLSPRSSLKIHTSVNVFDYEPTFYEAPLSPRAKQKPYSFSSISENTEIPPSPPSAQSYLMGNCPSKRAEKQHGEDDVTATKHLTRQIRSLKRKIKQFEEDFEKEKGYKPSHIDKSTQPEIKKMMGELKRANKQLKEAKEEAVQAKVPLHNTLPSKARRNLGDFSSETTHLDIMRDALDQAQYRLQEKRIEGDRPQDLNQMDRHQVQDEKTAIQKALLQLENRFGRPSTKETKELMKPLYDRYRTLKKLIAKFEIRRATEENTNPLLDLQTIDEHAETKEFKPKQLGEVHSKYRDDEAEQLEEEMGTTDFAVTQDFSLMKSSAPPLTVFDESYPSFPEGEGRRDSLGGRDSTSPALDLIAPNLHEASVVELISSQNQAKEDKRRLRKVLKEFEDNFFQETGRRVQREDRTPMETEYNEYKHLKQQLKLLDALIAKHHSSMESRTMATM